MAFDEKDQIDIATRLLNSHDTMVAAAAKRIFSPTQIPVLTHQNQTPKETKPSEDNAMATSEKKKPSPAVSSECISTTFLSPHRNASQSIPEPLSLVNPLGHIDDSPSDSVPINNSMHDPSTGFNLVSILPLKAESRKNQTTRDERLQRSRERNKVHARRTRQRKKEHMQDLAIKATDLKQKQISLKSLINEKNTANILLAMFSPDNSSESKDTSKDDRIDHLLKRSNEEIPDASKITELPALVLPGHNNYRKKESSCIAGDSTYPNDGIDYELLTKDRSKCTIFELDKIRKERNRMHAKRTRDRKKRFMDEMEKIIKKLESENELLSNQLQGLSDIHTPLSGNSTPSLASSPSFGPKVAPDGSPSVVFEENVSSLKNDRSSIVTNSDTITVSDDGVCSNMMESNPPKRQCVGDPSEIRVPISITTTSKPTTSSYELSSES